jgi:hypothetical protein
VLSWDEVGLQEIFHSELSTQDSALASERS